MKFHIIIKDNTTGETLLATDTNGVIGGVLAEGGAHGILLTHCNEFELAQTVAASESAKAEAMKERGPAFTCLVAAILQRAKRSDIDVNAKPDENLETEEGVKQ